MEKTSKARLKDLELKIKEHLMTGEMVIDFGDYCLDLESAKELLNELENTVMYMEISKFVNAYTGKEK